ncbi:MAG TPA: hypothetical protein DGK91_05000 [Clostridium sp.]|jgi:hypothetical protein|nr:hypothetical protein [Clostridia bacterium]HCW03943.1 hypothetical protein [Clostridium sp.]
MELSVSNSKDKDTSKEKTSADTDIEELASFSDLLFFIGDSINVFTKSDRLSLLAANIKLLGGIFAIAAALWAASKDDKNKYRDSCTRSINKQVIIGGIISQIGAMILTDALQKSIDLDEGNTIQTISPF